MASDDEARRRNRERHPSVAAIVDEVRKHFPKARVVAIHKAPPDLPDPIQDEDVELTE